MPLSQRSMTQVAQFEAANPDIDVESVEYEWTGPTFAAQLLGGTLPDVFTIPFTDGKSLIGQDQLADISDYVAELPYADQFNPNVLATGQDADGNIFAIPTAAYGIGLHYNRALFEEAGLDPDQPPTTWAEVAQYAKAIADETGQAGYSQMSQSNTGAGSSPPSAMRMVAASRRSTAPTSRRRSTTPAHARLSTTCATCAGTRTPWAATSCTTGARSTPTSRRASSGCTRAAQMSTTR